MRVFDARVKKAPTLGHRPELDGIRGVAILAVLVAHTQIWFRGLSIGGALGVDLFFVLSGFLITTLLAQEHESTGSVRRLRFYGRRALRLVPALGFALILGAVVASLIHVPTAGGRRALMSSPYVWQYPKAAATVLLFAGNWLQPKVGVLGHTWSLAVEEQYYLVWPFVLALALRRRGNKLRLAGVLFTLALLVAGARSFMYHDARPLTRPWWALHAWIRADGILIGSALALVLLSPSGARVKQFFRDRSAAFAALIAAAAVATRVKDLDPSGWDGIIIANLCFAILIGHIVADPRSPISRVFRTAGLRSIGRISYALYLLHWPVFVLVYTRVRDPWTGIALAWGGSLFLALVSYVVIERPALRLKKRLVPPARPAPVGVGRRRPRVSTRVSTRVGARAAVGAGSAT